MADAVGVAVGVADAVGAAVGVAGVVGVAAGVAGWLAAAGVLLLLTLALTWISVALGLVARSVETASNLPMVFLLLPFLGSGFVPADSMPAGLRWFAEYQPFTPMMETLRGLLLGTGIGNHGWLAAAWCVALTAVGFVWARRLYNRDPR